MGDIVTAKKLIADALSKKSTTLNLSGLGLTTADLKTLMPEMTKASHRLTALNLSNNRLDKIPEEMKNLVSLNQLNLQNNRFTDWPEALEALPLKDLNLSGNFFSDKANKKINELSSQRLELTIVTQRSVTKNRDGLLKSSRGAKTATPYRLYKNAKSRISKYKMRGKTTNTTLLNLSDAGLTTAQLKKLIPYIIETFGSLDPFKELDLSGNQLDRIPKAMRKFSNLTTLNLKNNKLTKIPAELVKFHLDTLNVSGNSFSRDAKKWLFGFEAGRPNLNMVIERNHKKNDHSYNFPEANSALSKKAKNRTWKVRLENRSMTILNLSGLSLTTAQVAKLMPDVKNAFQKNKNLQELNLGDNELEDIPDELYLLRNCNLKTLNLQNNRLVHSPKILEYLSTDNLDLSGNFFCAKAKVWLNKFKADRPDIKVLTGNEEDRVTGRSAAASPVDSDSLAKDRPDSPSQSEISITELPLQQLPVDHQLSDVATENEEELQPPRLKRFDMDDSPVVDHDGANVIDSQPATDTAATTKIVASQPDAAAPSLKKAQEIINEIILRKESILDLSGLGLETAQLEVLAPFLKNTSGWLETLDLSNNQLESIPGEIFQAAQLKTLVLKKNKLTTLPEDALEALPLHTLHVWDNSFQHETRRWLNDLKAKKPALRMVIESQQTFDLDLDNRPTLDTMADDDNDHHTAPASPIVSFRDMHTPPPPCSPQLLNAPGTSGNPLPDDTNTNSDVSEDEQQRNIATAVKELEDLNLLQMGSPINKRNHSDDAPGSSRQNARQDQPAVKRPRH